MQVIFDYLFPYLTPLNWILYYLDHFLLKSNNAKLVTKKDGTKTS